MSSAISRFRIGLVSTRDAIYDADNGPGVKSLSCNDLINSSPPPPENVILLSRVPLIARGFSFPFGTLKPSSIEIGEIAVGRAEEIQDSHFIYTRGNLYTCTSVSFRSGNRVLPRQRACQEFLRRFRKRK